MLHKPPRCSPKQFFKLLLVEPRHASGAVAARSVARRDQVQAAVSHAFQRVLRKSCLRRVALVVGRVDDEQRGRNALEFRRWIVVARRPPRLDEVVGVGQERRV